jgi:hypothetical protein
MCKVKQMRKAYRCFFGGRRAVVFDVVDGKKVPSKAGQGLIA